MGIKTGCVSLYSTVWCSFFTNSTQDKEALLFERGQEQERLKELTVLCERQRSKLNEKGQDTKDLERALTSSKEATRLAEKQVRTKER